MACSKIVILLLKILSEVLCPLNDNYVVVQSCMYIGSESECVNWPHWKASLKMMQGDMNLSLLLDASWLLCSCKLLLRWSSHTARNVVVWTCIVQAQPPLKRSVKISGIYICICICTSPEHERQPSLGWQSHILPPFWKKGCLLPNQHLWTGVSNLFHTVNQTAFMVLAQSWKLHHKEES